MKKTMMIGGKEVRHNSRPWRVVTNRHMDSGDRSWGWIDGCPVDITWGSDGVSSETAAAAVEEHNQWLKDLAPIGVQLARATDDTAMAKRRYDQARREATTAREEYDRALEIEARLEERMYEEGE